MKITPQKFSILIEKYTKELTKDLSIEKIASLNHFDLNKQAIKLAQEELKEDKFICPICNKDFYKYECAKELCDSQEYFCQECWNKEEI